MQIPEELQRLSNKELKKILKPNIFQAKYIIDYFNNNEGKIVEIEAKIGKYFYIKNGNRLLYREIQPRYYKPLTFESLQKFRKNNIINKVNEWSQKTFQKWCLIQFNAVYGEKYVDVQDEYIIVHFPEITISNSLEQSHTMHDIYLKFYIENAVVLAGLKRGTLTDCELRNNYTFSHVNNYGNVFNWADSFCFGETNISTLKSIVQRDRISAFKNLRFFLEAIKEYLSWESLEGTPYNKIDNVIYDKMLWRTVTCPYFDEEKVYNNVINSLQNFTYTFEIAEDYYTDFSEESKKIVEDILTKNFPNLVFDNLNGASVERNNILQVNYSNVESTYFKGVHIPFKLINTDSIFVSLPKKIHKGILNYVIYKINKNFNNFLIQYKIDEYTRN